MHDGTIRTKTVRIGQRERAYVEFIQRLIRGVGGSAWTYREGRTRELHIVEFSKSFLGFHRVETRDDKIDYVRGYFDAEGGIPRSSSVRPYLFFAQKDRRDLEQVREFLLELEVACGRMHNPSRKNDPDYWRFYVSRSSLRRFATFVGSWHPTKANLLRKMIQSMPYGDIGRT